MFHICYVLIPLCCFEIVLMTVKSSGNTPEWQSGKMEILDRTLRRTIQ